MRPSHRRLPGAAAASNCIHFEGLHIPDQNASASPASRAASHSARLCGHARTAPALRPSPLPNLSLPPLPCTLKRSGVPWRARARATSGRAAACVSRAATAAAVASGAARNDRKCSHGLALVGAAMRTALGVKGGGATRLGNREHGDCAPVSRRGARSCASVRGCPCPSTARSSSWPRTRPNPSVLSVASPGHRTTRAWQRPSCAADKATRCTFSIFKASSSWGAAR